MVVLQAVSHWAYLVFHTLLLHLGLVLVQFEEMIFHYVLKHKTLELKDIFVTFYDDRVRCDAVIA